MVKAINSEWVIISWENSESLYKVYLKSIRTGFAVLAKATQCVPGVHCMSSANMLSLEYTRYISRLHPLPLRFVLQAFVYNLCCSQCLGIDNRLPKNEHVAMWIKLVELGECSPQTCRVDLRLSSITLLKSGARYM